MSRLLIVSNRLPVTVRTEAAGVEVQPSVGGLATGLRGPHERSGGLWIGWSGLVDPLPDAEAQALAAQLAAMRLVQVQLTAEEVHRYYGSYSNGVLWPLFHYFANELPLEIAGFEDYERVNRRFADAVVAHHRPGDLIWVQDYQLMRVPALVREQLPDARIGFFLHIPFPSSETFRILPQREPILEGLLGADLVGFHTAAYVRHFSSSVLRTTGAWTDVDRILWRGREVRLGVFPMGVDAAHWTELGGDPGIGEEIRALRPGPQQLLVGIDRLDYTKGISRRLLAYEQLLVRHPDLREQVRLVQVAVPSRTGVGAYQGVRETVDALVGRINGRFGTPTWSPVHYLFRGLSPKEIAALYRAADVLHRHTHPGRDEPGGQGVHRFPHRRRWGAGPLRVHRGRRGARRGVAGQPLRHRRHRGRALSRAPDAGAGATPPDGARCASASRPTTCTAGRASSSTCSGRTSGRHTPSGRPHRRCSPRHRPGSATPPRQPCSWTTTGPWWSSRARRSWRCPTSSCSQLLSALARRYAVHVVSGRRRDTLERWLGALPVGLHAEHGYWSRMPGERWVGAEVDPSSWLPQVKSILEEYAARTPGALVEVKTAGLAWHYRAADPEFGAAQAGDLLLHLATLLSNAPAEVLTGDQVVEIRPQGVNKGQVVPAVAGARPSGKRRLRARRRPHRRGPLRRAARRGPSRCTSAPRRAGPSCGCRNVDRGALVPPRLLLPGAPPPATRAA